MHHIHKSRAVPRGTRQRAFTVPARVAPTPEPTVPRLAYSIDEAATAIGVSVSTIKRLINDGQLESVKAQHRRVIPVAALTHFLTK